VSQRERVLVVDEGNDTAEVLQAVLEPRGLTVNRISRLDQTPFPSSEARPAVVVLDADSSVGANCPDWERWRNVPQVIIGTIDVSPKASHTIMGDAAGRRYLQKPFQFAELVQAIEALVAVQPRASGSASVNK